MEPVISIVAAALLVSLALNAWLLERLLSKRRRRANSECLKCGYDVRNHSGRCPECGEPVPIRPPSPRRRTWCSFCGRTNDTEGAMVEGPGDVFICARCVELSAEILAANRAAAADAKPPSSPPSPPSSPSHAGDS